MKATEQKFFLGGFLTVFLILSAGCASIPRHTLSSDTSFPDSSYLLSPAPDFTSAEFVSRWSGDLGERDKMRYLLERVAGSDLRFIRNGQTHDGRKVRQWLLFKLNHWVQGVKTADEFITRVASYSQKTGKPYLVEFSGGKVYSLQSILRSELLVFERYHNGLLANAGHVTSQPPAAVSGPSQATLPPILTARTSR